MKLSKVQEVKDQTLNVWDFILVSRSKWCVLAPVKSARANEITDYLHLPAKIREKLVVILSV